MTEQNPASETEPGLASHQVEAVLALHAADWRGYCAECNRMEGHGHLWPCATVQVIQQASQNPTSPT